MNIAALLEAAEFLEKCDTNRNGKKNTVDSFVCNRSADREELIFTMTTYHETEHGYATTMPMPQTVRSFSKRMKSRKNSGSRSNHNELEKNRTTHNELEKNRRAHLKNCLDALKDMVPLGPEASRHTTLGLLTKARKFIKNLEEKERRNYAYKEKLSKEQKYLKRRLDQLQQYRTKRRSVSECSSSTVSSSHSTTSHSSVPSPISESDEVDVIGYGSTQSDTDDYSSIQSASSDSGMSISTTLLRFSEMETI